MKNIFLSIIGIFSCSLVIFSQSYTGHTVDNFAGIHGVIYNPANVVASNLRADINLISTSVLIDNDYLGLGIGNIADIGDEFDDSLERFKSDANNFNINADILGPSFMFNLNKKNSIAFTSRVRVMSNINNINGELFETIADDFGDEDDFDFDNQNFVGTAHAWAEICLSYGRILISKPKHLLTGGVTVKYLQGAGGAFTKANSLEGNYNGSTELLQSNGLLTYGTSSDFDLDDIEFDNLTAGFGLDIGFVYEWHPNRKDEETRYFQDPYKLKIGVSITDIGSINYDNGEVTTYDMNNTVDTSTYEDDLQEFLDNNYDSTIQSQSTSFQLPTALHLLLDYRLAKKWLISAQADLSVVATDEQLNNAISNTITLMPRFESKWFSLYAPVSLRQYGGFNAGAGLRFGPLSIGSGSILSNLLSDSTQSADVFFGLKIPLYRK
ncbi:DUF5723 family protein [Winogradskyella alexanderae]|uniref:DUF5723 family protein n=1 Tax=Winogradskyella alexanderae TaxID=2877123 RepID=A0ABS7XXK2_9FLAO|nr:DUF5723 family protein [Winogradskyella alexanderae]MCA0133716.1 DUF5723 family protein [Winogradskyella alexanderae]